MLSFAFVEGNEDLIEQMVEYFQLFGDKSICFSDLCLYLDLLDSAQTVKVCVVKYSYVFLNISFVQKVRVKVLTIILRNPWLLFRLV